MTASRKRRSIERQEEVVAALWEFAADITLRPNEGTVAAVPSRGVAVSLTHIGTALRKIMDAFGYQVTEIQ